MRIKGQHIEMIATNGDHRLGGKDWDDIIVNQMAEEFDRAAWRKSVARSAKLPGSAHPRVVSQDPAFQPRSQSAIVHHHNGKSVKLEITREEFETPQPASGREMQDDLRNGDAGSEHEVGRYRQDFARRRHDPHADGPQDDFASLTQSAGD